MESRISPSSSSLALARTFLTKANDSSKSEAAFTPPTKAAPTAAKAEADVANAAAGTADANFVIAAPVPLAIC